MDWFYREVVVIENEVRYFIDDLFKILRFVEGVFDMFLNFRYIRFREVINL